MDGELESGGRVPVSSIWHGLRSLGYEVDGSQTGVKELWEARMSWGGRL